MYSIIIRYITCTCVYAINNYTVHVHGTMKLYSGLWFILYNYVNIDYGHYLVHFHFPYSSIISHDSLNRKSEPDFHSLLEAEVNRTDQSNQL